MFFFTGTKSDLRESGENLVSLSEARKMRKNIRAHKYMECSAIKNEGVREIFEESIRCVYRKSSYQKRTCTLL